MNNQTFIESYNKLENKYVKDLYYNYSSGASLYKNIKKGQALCQCKNTPTKCLSHENFWE